MSRRDWPKLWHSRPVVMLLYNWLVESKGRTNVCMEAKLESPLVGLSVHPSVTLVFKRIQWFIELRERDLWRWALFLIETTVGYCLFGTKGIKGMSDLPVKLFKSQNFAGFYNVNFICFNSTGNKGRTLFISIIFLSQRPPYSDLMVK